MNFKSNAAYKAWLAYGHASGEFAKTPGNQPVSIKGKSHGVQHAFGGEMYAAGGSFNNPGFQSLPKDVQAKIKARTFANGGPMAQLTEFTEGGRHEENPIGGIPQGFAPDGRPNLVEQGETKLNSDNYIYSDTLKVTKDIALDFSLPKNSVGKTFAQVSKDANRPKSRRENDTIEEVAIKRDLDNLMQAQEEFKKRDLEKDMQMMMEKHPQEMQQLMAGAEMAQQGMPQEQMMPPQEMAPEEQIPQSAQMGMPQGQPMDPNQMPPEMLAQMQGAQQGAPVMRMGGNIYMCGGKMYDFGGTMYANGGNMYPYGGPLLGGATTNNGYMSGYAQGSNPNLTNPGLSNPWATDNTNAMYDMMHQYDAQPAGNPMFDLNAPIDTTPDIAVTGDAAGKGNLMGKAGTGIGIASTVAQGAMEAANIAQQQGASDKQKAEQYGQTAVDTGMGVVGSIIPVVGMAYGVGKGLGNLTDKIGTGSDEVVMSPDGTEQVVRHGKEGAQFAGDFISNNFNPGQNVSQGLGYLSDKDYKKAAMTFLAPLGGAQIARSMDRKEDNKKADAWERMRKGPQVSTLGIAVDDREDTNSGTNPYSLYSKKYGGYQFGDGGKTYLPNLSTGNRNASFGSTYNIGAKPTAGSGPGGREISVPDSGLNSNDSAMAMNRAQAVEKFYTSRGYVKDNSPAASHSLTGKEAWTTLKNARKQVYENTKKNNGSKPVGVGGTSYDKFSQYYKEHPTDKNKFLQRENQATLLNTDAPMMLYDRRINPQQVNTYRNSEGDVVSIPFYNRLATTPFNQLSAAEKKQRMDQGFSVPDSYRKQFNKPANTAPSTPAAPAQTTPVEYDENGIPIVAPPRDPFATPDVAQKPIPTMDEMMAGAPKEPMVNVKAEEFYFRPAHEAMYNEYGEHLGNRDISPDEVKRRFAAGEQNPSMAPYASSYNDGTSYNQPQWYQTQIDAENQKYYVGAKDLNTYNTALGTRNLTTGTTPTNPVWIDRRYEGNPYTAATPESQKYFGGNNLYPTFGGEAPQFTPAEARPDVSGMSKDTRERMAADINRANQAQYQDQLGITETFRTAYPNVPQTNQKMGGFLDSDFSIYNDNPHSYSEGGKINSDDETKPITVKYKPEKGETRLDLMGNIEMFDGKDWKPVSEIDLTKVTNNKASENLVSNLQNDAELVNRGAKDYDYLAALEYESELQRQNETLKDKNLDLEMNQSLPEFLAAAAPAAYNLGQGVFGKAQKLNPDDYRVKEDMQPYKYNIEPQLRSADRSYAQGQNAIRNAGLSGGNYASNMQQLANARNQEISDLYAQKQNIDAASYNQAMAQNKAIEAENLQRRLGIEDFNRQSAAAKAAMLQTGMQQLAQISEGSQGKKMQLALMKAIAPDYAGTLSYNNIMDQYLNKVKKKKESKKTK